MNPLQAYLNPAETVEAYKRLHQRLGIDGVIFRSMEQVAQRKNFQFTPPVSPSDHPRKHQEIEGLLGRYQSALMRKGLFLDLVEEIYLQLQTDGMHTFGQHLLDLTVIQLEQEIKCRLREDAIWVIEWGLHPETSGELNQNQQYVTGSVYKSDWGQIIPWDVIQYLRSGVLLFRQKAYTTALALMSIAVEATLRDILSTKGYTFNHGANRVNIYPYVRAQIDVTGNSYTVTFIDAVPRSATNLASSTGNAAPIPVEIRREEKPAKGRVDLTIKCPSLLLDHWSSSRVQQPAVTNNIGGLGEALRIAREVEHIIDAVDLPLDVDEVLMALRNNLIHFSSDSMDTVLTKYAAYSPTGQFTLRDFVSDVRMVFDFISDVPRFVDDQYLKLWRARTRIP
jgi:hypothetical protein